jgi:predicted HTH transcriptional regulator
MAQTLPHQFISIYTKALQGGTEVTLEELAKATGIDSTTHILDQVQSIRQILQEFELTLMPDLTSGEMTTIRVLRQVKILGNTQEEVVREISRGENTTHEYKSSLIYDHKRAAAGPSTPKTQLKSDEVTHSCLKTIGAFLAASGGVVYVGVNDAGQCIGIENDFYFLKQGNGDRDSWELHLRNLISSRFKDGDAVNNYVQIAFFEIQGKTIVRLEVQRRTKLSFLKKDTDFGLYRRQGNRTIEVKIDEVEEFIELRRKEVEEARSA